MRSTKLYHLIKTLSSSDREKVKLFIASLTGKNKEFLLRLFILTENDLNENKPPSVLENQKHRFIQNLKHTSFEKLKYQLTEEIKHYISYQALRTDRAQRERYLLNWAKKHNKEKLFYSFYKNIQKTTSRSSDAFIFDLEQKFIAEKEMNFFLSKDGKRKGNTNLDTLHLALDEEFIFRKIYYSCLSFNQRRIIKDKSNAHFENDLLESALAYVYAQPVKDRHPLVNIYYHIYQVLSRSKLKDFEALLHLIEIHKESYDAEEVRDWNLYVLNHCINKINTQQQSYLETALKLYQLFLAESPLRTLANKQGRLHPHHYKNIVKVGSQLHKFDWVFTFIQEYAELLPQDHATSHKAYNLGILYFFQADFKTAAQYFSQVVQDSEEVFWRLDGYTYFYRSCFECLLGKNQIESSGVDISGTHELPNELIVDWYDQLENLDRFRMYITRLKYIPEERKEKYAAFLRFMTRLFNAYNQIDTELKYDRLSKLKQDILQYKGELVGEDWLIEKAKQLLSDLK
ncbi:MAG: hypothetical protein AAFP83_21910 [Bacteroidota bacterium]